MGEEQYGEREGEGLCLFVCCKLVSMLQLRLLRQPSIVSSILQTSNLAPSIWLTRKKIPGRRKNIDFKKLEENWTPFENSICRQVFLSEDVFFEIACCSSRTVIRVLSCWYPRQTKGYFFSRINLSNFRFFSRKQCSTWWIFIRGWLVQLSFSCLSLVRRVSRNKKAAIRVLFLEKLLYFGVPWFLVTDSRALILMVEVGLSERGCIAPVLLVNESYSSMRVYVEHTTYRWHATVLMWQWVVSVFEIHIYVLKII